MHIVLLHRKGVSNLKRIIFASLSIVTVVALVAGVTYSKFFDTETSVENTLASGTLDLKVDDLDDDSVLHFDFDNLKPGWSNNYSWVLKNAGSVSGQPSLTFSSITNNENGVLEPEVGANGENGDEPGELGSILRMNIYWRQDAGTWNYIGSTIQSGDPILNSVDGKTVGLGLYSGDRIDNKLPVLAPGEEVEVQLRPFWHDDPGIDDNKAQGDSVSFDLVFKLEQ